MHSRPNITRRALLYASAALLASRALPACAREEGESAMLQSSFLCFDTPCAIGADAGREALDAAVARCMRLEGLLSRTLPTSDISRINSAGGAPVEVDAETAGLIEAALSYSEVTGGSFDITIGALSELYDFHEGVAPSDEDIERALPHVGWEGVEVSGRTVSLADPEAKLDLGGIAKGYAADAVAADLERAGCSSAFINLGGNVRVVGRKQDGSAWNVGIRDPEGDTSDDIVSRIPVEDGSVVTSGLYERRFEDRGRAWWHILDPRTGYPVESGVVSASLCGARSLDGDGLSKAPFFMGEDEALGFLESRDQQALLIRADGALASTTGSDFEPA